MFNKNIKVVIVFILLLNFFFLDGKEVFDVYEVHRVKYRRDLKRSCMIGCYYPNSDRIRLLRKGSYVSVSELNQTALHELAHWTRHESRLGPLGGSYRYPGFWEEILCDISAAVVADELGLARASDREVCGYVHDYLGHRRLKETQWALIFKEILGTVSYLLAEEYPQSKLMKHFVDIGIIHPTLAEKLEART